MDIQTDTGSVTANTMLT